jgi:benzoyl-CoA reductase/2-hydroxyglutaryl-CoA dehydratase subunit BcrC/BadD/HgdB
MNIQEQIMNVARTRPQDLKKLKGTGTKIVGYTGRFVPEELIYASGALPYLLCKGGQPDPPDTVLPYMLRFMSPYARAQIGYHLMGLDPVVPLLDLIIAECSDCHLSRLADLFEYFELPTAKLGIPPDWEKKISYDYYYRGLIRIKGKLESLTGQMISDERLKEAIQSLNRVRRSLRKIDDLRKRQPSPIGGYDFIRLNHCSFYYDLIEQSKQYDALYEHLKEKKSSFAEDAPRILLAGHVVAVGDYVVPKLVEDSGGVIVAEFLDEGNRLFQWDVHTEGDLMKNIANTYYLERIHPSLFQPGWEDRFAFLEKIITDRKIDAVIWYQLSFEEVYDMEYSIIARRMKELNLPLLKLESSYEYAREAMGTLTTRVESFIESIKSKRRI